MYRYSTKILLFTFLLQLPAIGFACHWWDLVCWVEDGANKAQSAIDDAANKEAKKVEQELENAVKNAKKEYKKLEPLLDCAGPVFALVVKDEQHKSCESIFNSKANSGNIITVGNAIGKTVSCLEDEAKKILPELDKLEKPLLEAQQAGGKATKYVNNGKWIAAEAEARKVCTDLGNKVSNKNVKFALKYLNSCCTKPKNGNRSQLKTSVQNVMTSNNIETDKIPGLNDHCASIGHYLTSAGRTAIAAACGYVATSGPTGFIGTRRGGLL